MEFDSINTENYTLKYYIKLITVITFSLLILSCSNNNSDNADTNVPEQEAVPAETSPANTQSNYDPDAIEKYDFRKAHWGMSKQEVKDSEDGEPALEKENNLEYSTVMFEVQFQIGYTFFNDELIRAGFLMLTKPETNEEYVEKYNQLKKELTKINGEPVIDTKQSIDPSKTVAEDKKADAVCNGDMLYATQWDLPHTDIQLVLRGDKSECVLTVLYLSEEGVRKLLEERTN